MGDLLNQITSFLGGNWDSPVVQLGLRAIAIYVVILWLAAAYWAFRDMQLRTANPILPYFAASLVIIFTPVFFPFAIIAYRIVRPQEKIGEVYERTLAEEALLAEVEAVKSCPTCARRINEEWIICPSCRTRLNRVCPNCSRLVGLDWSLCAWCGRDFERAVPGFEAIAPPRPAAARPAPDPSFARPSAAPALEATSYRPPPAVVPPPPLRDSSLDAARMSAYEDDDLPSVSSTRRSPTGAPQPIGGGSTGLASAYDASAGRSLERTAQPPSIARSGRTATPPRSVKPPAKGPRSSTDPLPER
jgi:RNA polymerase subunit RPABC4/transcription elongation factor Spt4